MKPDIVGADCGETALAPLNENNWGFCGTSQASPHVAGMAALVRQAFPDYSPVQVANYLKNNAAQRENPDPNNTWGHGFAQLPPPPAVETACATGSAVTDAANNPGLVADCQALLSYRDTLAGTGTLDWSASTPIANWDGVTVGGTPQRVTELQLSFNQLTGTIPSSLGNLANLQELELWGNELTGSIPPELGDLANLQELDLDLNELTGWIPPELGNLANLRELRLWDNQLTGSIPPELSNLANLQYLSLWGNQLTGCIPAGLRDVAENDLDRLGLDFCTGCAADGAVTDAANNPGLVADCEALLSSRDTLAGTGTLDWSASTPIANWDGVTVGGTPQRVIDLSLEDKGLTGLIPPELGNLAYLQYLVLHSNQLTGPIPAELGNLTNLWALGLIGNQLTGSIPPELGDLTNLGLVGLDGNQLTGSIPPELGDLTKLIFLGLSGNRLSGPIPSSLGNLTNLEDLYLYDNQLTGSIPPELGNLANLENLYLAYNQLTGCISAGLRDVADNDFTELGLDFCLKMVELEPSMTVSPNQGIPGDSINVQLHDFQTGDVVTRIELARTVDICDDASSCSALGARGAVGDNGSLSFSFVIPSSVSPGAQDLRVHTTNGNANTTFIVGDGELQLSTTDVLPNQRISISGSGFTKSSNQDPAYIGGPDGEHSSCPDGNFGSVTLGGQQIHWNRLNDGDGIEVTSGGT